jgi:hypothetical protein
MRFECWAKEAGNADYLESTGQITKDPDFPKTANASNSGSK